jgi:DNA-binding transcriptional MocR family regulator
VCVQLIDAPTSQTHRSHLHAPDAYFYLQFNTAAATDPSQQPGVRGLGRSLLSYDTRGGLVVRLDTASKMVAPGLRVGWISTCHAGLHTCLVRTMQGSVQGSSSMSQVLLNSLFRQWHPTQGLHAHLQRLQASYAARCAALCAAADKHLGPSRATWLMPSAGMFLWLRLTCATPHVSGVVDTETELQPLLGEYKVAAVPGARFSAQPLRSPFLRLSFASATDTQFEAGMQRLAKLLDHADAVAKGRLEAV